MKRSLSQPLRVAAWLTLALHAHAVAAATPKAEVADRTNDAKASYRQGETEYKLGRFDEALAAFSRAYELNAIPGFLFNIGQCHFQLKNYERAIFFYEGYLRDSPAAPNRAATQGQIAMAKRELAKQQRLARKTPMTPTAVAPTPTAEPSSAPIAVKPYVVPASEPAVVPMQAAPQVEASTPVYKTWWLWTIVGVVVVGGAAAATAVVLTSKPKAVLPSGSLPTIDLRGQ